MSLGQMLTELIEGLVAGGPAESVAVMRKLIADLKAAGIGNNALKAGDTLPDATLIDPFGKPVSIADLAREGPMIINFYRGDGARCATWNSGLTRTYSARSKQPALS